MPSLANMFAESGWLIPTIVLILVWIMSNISTTMVCPSFPLQLSALETLQLRACLTRPAAASAPMPLCDPPAGAPLTVLRGHAQDPRQ